MQLIDLEPKKLKKVYDIIYAAVKEGNSMIGQERTCYLGQDSFSDSVLDYACCDWSLVRDLGFDVYGYEPCHNNSNKFIYSDIAMIDKKFDCLYTSVL